MYGPVWDRPHDKSSCFMSLPKTYYYERRPENKKVDPGDLTEVRAIREKLQCKSFEWYMKEIGTVFHDFYANNPFKSD